MKRMPWYLRDLLYLVTLVVVLLGVQYLLEHSADYYPAMRYYTRILVLIGISITLAVSLNIINGHAGQFSLGHAGFMAVGAYFSAWLTLFYFGPYVDKLPESSQFIAQNVFFVIAVLVAGLVAAAAGYLVGKPSLRLRGDYLAIVTLGFGEIIRVIILNVEKIGAARGLSGIPPWSNFFWVYFLAIITVIVSVRLVKSSVGRAFLAVREDQIAAEAMGVDTTRYKVKAFMIGSFFAGTAGALFAHYTPAYLNPQTFNFTKSFDVIVMVVLGGLGSISGSIVAAILLTILPEVLRVAKPVLHMTKDPRMVIYSIMLITLMLTRPQGLLGRRELWDVLARRKDSIPKEKRDEGNADDKLDRDAGPPVT
jgi:branched-chain amino acid transport system permease protein